MVMDAERIKKSVNDYKNANGGIIPFTTKELIVGLYDKFDDVDKRVSIIEAKVSYNRATLGVLVVITTGLILKLVIL